MINKTTTGPLTGVFTVRKRDANTLELKETKTEYNNITVYGIGRFSNFYDDDEWLDSNDSPSNIALSKRTTSQNPFVIYLDRSNDTELTTGDTRTVDPFTDENSTPPISEVEWRFNAPASFKEYNTIALLRQFASDGDEQVLAYVSLNTPCTQDTDEVLDVTYRIIFNESSVTPSSNTIGQSSLYQRGMWQAFFTNNRSNTFNRANRSRISFSNASSYETFISERDNSIEMKDNIADHGKGEVSAGVEQGNYDEINLRYKLRPSANLPKEDSNRNGKLFGTVFFGNGDGGSDSRPAVAWGPIAPNSFIGKPIQPIHNHNKDSTQPFLDLNNLAGGSGVVKVNGDNWNDPDFPTYYRIDHITTGDVGSSTYTFRKRATFGFFNEDSQNVTYYPTTTEILDHRVARDPDGLVTVKGVDNDNDHGLSVNNVNRLESYDKETLIMWDQTGVIIQQQQHGFVNVFDANTTPALNVSGVKQVVRDSQGSLFVADAASGCYRIDDPLTESPSVTHFTNADNGIPTDGDTACHGVAQGYEGRMWALFDGGLSYTDDNGTSWTNLDPSSSPSFDFPDITSSNWSGVQFIQADRQASGHQLALIWDTQDGTDDPYQVVWYSLETGQTTRFTGTQFAPHYNSVRCSLSGSTWVGIRFNDQATFRLKFDTSSDMVQLDWNNDTRPLHKDSSIIFMYDYYNSPIIITNGGEPNYDGASALMAKQVDQQGISRFNESTVEDNGNEITALTSFEEQFTGTFVVKVRGGERDNWPRDITQYDNNYNPGSIINGPTSYKDAGDNDKTLTEGAALSLNHVYTPFEEVTWRRYHWDGSNWIKNYFVDAVDTASFTGGPFPGSRENFDTENHFFTGRSLVDGSSAFASGNFTNPTDATWAFTVTPSAKLNTSPNLEDTKDQEAPRTVFEVADPSIDHRLSVLWDDGDGNIVVEEDINNNSTVTHTITTTPADGTQYRFVVTLSGTTLNLYLDGSQIGSSITLASGLDFSNSNNTLKYIIGARAYLWNYQRNTLLPGNFYRGIMENIQVWNGQWNSTDISNDASDPSGVITTSNGDLVVRYQLTEDLTGLESKTTHTNDQDLDEGLLISFESGTDTDFIATDYHTFAAYDGILNDNSMSFTYQQSLYVLPVDTDFSEFTAPDETDTIPSSSTTDVTEKAAMIRGTSNDIIGGVGFASYLDRDRNQRTGSTRSAFSVQNITGDGYFEGSPSANDSFVGLGVTATPVDTETLENIDFGFFFNTDGSVDITESGTTTQTGITTYTVKDIFRVRRSGTTIEYVKIDGTDSTETIVHTSSNTTSSTLYGIGYFGVKSAGAHNLSINYTQPAYTMRVGTKSTDTGAFDPSFLRVETHEIDTALIKIDGNDATPLTGNDTWWGDMPTPGPGQVVINGASGHLIFNSDDAGKQVTGTIIVVYRMS